MPREPVTAKELREIAERLRITRDAFGYTQGFISRLIGSTTESGQETLHFIPLTVHIL